MTDFVDWINNVTDMNIRPETLFFIFLGLAGFSLITLLIIFTRTINKPKKASVKFKEEILEEPNLFEVEPLAITEEQVIEENNQEKSLNNELPIINNFSEEISKEAELIPTNEISAIELIETEPKINPGIIQETMPNPNLPPVFSSVYLEPRKEEIPELLNEDLQTNARATSLDQPFISPSFEVDNQYQEIERQAEANQIDFEISAPEVLDESTPLQFESKPKEVNPDNLVKERSVTANALKERLARLQAQQIHQDKNNETNELDDLFKVVGMDNNDIQIPNLDNEEKIILGR